MRRLRETLHTGSYGPWRGDFEQSKWDLEPSVQAIYSITFVTFNCHYMKGQNRLRCSYRVTSPETLLRPYAHALRYTTKSTHNLLAHCASRQKPFKPLEVATSADGWQVANNGKWRNPQHWQRAFLVALLTQTHNIWTLVPILSTNAPGKLLCAVWVIMAVELFGYWEVIENNKSKV